MTEETKVVENLEARNTREAEGDIQFDSDLISSFTDKTKVLKFTEESMQCNLVMDVGASQSRSTILMAGKKPSAKNIKITDSRYAIIDTDEDLSMYKKTSDNIVDNGEYFIKEHDSEYALTSWFKKETHVLKGKLIEKLGKAPRNIDNQSDKTNDIGIFINMLTTMADVGLERGIRNLKVRIAFTIPPKERYSGEKRIEKLKRTVAGVYTIKMPRYNYEVNIVIDEKDVFVETEGEAAFIYYTTRGKNARERYEEYRDKVVTIQDLGSSTFNIGLISDGSIQSGVSHTAKIGGENLVAKFYQILGRSRPEPISFEQARSAVETGYIMIGAQVIPVGNELTKAKKELSELLAKEFTTFLQVSGRHGSAIYAHIFVGRGMMETGSVNPQDNEPDAFYSPSIAHLLSQEYAKTSPSTQAIILNNPGLANLLGVASLMHLTWEIQQANK